MPYIKIRDIRDVAIRILPNAVVGGQDILIDLAAAHQLGKSVTMKQLVLSRGGSATTIRRQVNQLIKAGHVVKLPNTSDGRSDHFSVSQSLCENCKNIESEIRQIHAAYEERANHGANNLTLVKKLSI